LYPQKHLAASFLVAAASLFFDQKTPILTVNLFGFNLTVFILSILIGVLPDIDHIIDFRLNRNARCETLESQFENGRMYVPFHGFEAAILLAILAAFQPFLIFPTISYIIHMAMDAYGNNVSPQAYFYTVRFGRKLTHTPRQSTQ